MLTKLHNFIKPVGSFMLFGQDTRQCKDKYKYILYLEGEKTMIKEKIKTSALIKQYNISNCVVDF